MISIGRGIKVWCLCVLVVVVRLGLPTETHQTENISNLSLHPIFNLLSGQNVRFWLFIIKINPENGKLEEF